jgi:hypothetical protein
VIVSLGIWLAAAAGGCADVKPTHSGFLRDYARLQPAKAGEKDFDVKRAEPTALDSVDAFYIDEVAWRSPRPSATSVDADKQAPVLAKLREALHTELAKLKPVADRPGPRTARVRAAVTDAVEADVIFNIIMTVIAVPFSTGGATVEAEVVAPDGRQVAAIDYAREGGVLDIVGFYWPDDHAKQACIKAAAKLRDALEGR